MIESGGGSIINISSIAGMRAHSSTPYTTSKAAVQGLTMSMAADHGPEGIRVNCIAPGLVYSPMVAPGWTRTCGKSARMPPRCAPRAIPGTSATLPSFWLVTNPAGSTGFFYRWDAGLTSVTPVTYQTLSQQQYARPG